MAFIAGQGGGLNSWSFYMISWKARLNLETGTGEKLAALQIIF
jgi:hypothetical protein